LNLKQVGLSFLEIVQVPLKDLLLSYFKMSFFCLFGVLEDAFI